MLNSYYFRYKCMKRSHSYCQTFVTPIRCSANCRTLMTMGVHLKLLKRLHNGVIHLIQCRGVSSYRSRKFHYAAYVRRDNNYFINIIWEGIGREKEPHKPFHWRAILAGHRWAAIMVRTRYSLKGNNNNLGLKRSLSGCTKPIMHFCITLHNCLA